MVVFWELIILQVLVVVLIMLVIVNWSVRSGSGSMMDWSMVDWSMMDWSMMNWSMMDWSVRVRNLSWLKLLVILFYILKLISIAVFAISVEIVLLLVTVVLLVLSKLLLCKGSELLLGHRWSTSLWRLWSTSPLGSSSSLTLWSWALSILLGPSHWHPWVVSCVWLLATIVHGVSAEAISGDTIAWLLVCLIIDLGQIHVVGALVSPVSMMVPTVIVAVIVFTIVIVTAVGVTSVVVVFIRAIIIVVLLIIVLFVFTIVRLFFGHWCLNRWCWSLNRWWRGYNRTF